ncbi:hypothetical protein O3M35_006454 [Rhynocoris fuscipes]|uniref:CHK kinase-like domain-containing protein n=1 Tax=Rhynocoris fuscipes TaxID=488301 RepID=A0AAW1DEZ5_9HEMI
MSFITSEICEIVLKNKLKTENFQIESYSIENCNEEVIGFHAKESLFDFQHASVALITLADFHATFLIQQYVENFQFDEKYEEVCFESLFFQDDETIHEGLVFSFNNILKNICYKYFNKFTKNFIDKTFDNLKLTTIELLKKSKIHRNFLLHGDPWGNNILFKYNDNNQPIEAILVDFQAIRYAPPAVEVLHFLNVGTTNETLLKQDELKDIYFSRLTETLALKHIDINSILTKEDFLKSCKDFIGLTVALRLYYTTLLRLPMNHLKQIQKDADAFLSMFVYGDSENIQKAFEEDKIYQKLLIDCLENTFQCFGN